MHSATITQKVNLKGLALISTMLLAACAQPKPAIPLPTRYTPPSSGPAATVQIRSNPISSALLFTFEEGQNCQNRRVITSTSAKIDAQFNARTTIPAEQPVSLWLWHARPNNSACNNVISFKPKANRNYLLTVIPTITFGNLHLCGMTIQDITDPVVGAKMEPIVQRKLLPSSNPEGVHCSATDLDAQLNKASVKNLSGLQMDDLKQLLPPAAGAK